MGRKKRSPSAEGTRRGEHDGGGGSVRGISPEKMLGSERLNMRCYCILSAISVYKFSQFCRYVGRNIPDNCYV